MSWDVQIFNITLENTYVSALDVQKIEIRGIFYLA